MKWLLRRYNKRSAKKYGWHPSWFHESLSEFDEDLLEYIKLFQVQYALKPDGKVGPKTFQRLLTARDEDLTKDKDYILIDGRRKIIDCPTKINMLPSGTFRVSRKPRKPNMIVTHWDVCTSASKCYRVLKARGISSHFCIDNDGTIHQFVDTNNIAYHAGNPANKNSIGIDFSNAYYTKYNKWYKRKGFGPRPILTGSRVHGVRLGHHLGYYPQQIESYKKLLNILCDHYNIKKDVPRDEDGNLITKVVNEAKRAKFNGIVCHYHLTRNKIDCAGLELGKIVDNINDDSIDVNTN